MALSVSITLFSSFIIYCGYYFMSYGKKPLVSKKKNSKFSSFLEAHVSSLDERFWSFFPIPGGRFQTIFAALMPHYGKVAYAKRESIATPDGGQFSLHWAFSPDQSRDKDTQPLVIIFPGLTSHSDSGYIQKMVAELLERGFDAVVMVNRGIDVPCLTAKAFCAADCNDFALTISTLRERFPNRPIAAAAVSMGSLILCRYLALSGAQSKLHAAFIYACPFDTVNGSANIEKWDSWLLYNISITKELKRIYSRSADKFTGVVDGPRLRRSSSIREFDMHFTSKVFGYETVDHYYSDSVITPKFLHSFRTPTLCLCADDDAFIPIESVPAEAIAQTDYVALGVTHGGGHVGHLQGLNPFANPYFVDVMGDYMQAVFSHADELP